MLQDITPQTNLKLRKGWACGYKVVPFQELESLVSPSQKPVPENLQTSIPYLFELQTVTTNIIKITN